MGLKLWSSKTGAEVRDLPSELLDWVLPPWFSQQNNPVDSDYSPGKIGLYNYNDRSWTALKANAAKYPLFVDYLGIIYLVPLRISMEVWLYNQKQLFTPGNYLDVSQSFLASSGTIRVLFRFNNGCFTMTVGPTNLMSHSLLGIQIEMNHDGSNCLDEWIVAFVIRPYDYNGFSAIRSLEYKGRSVIVNGKKTLFFETEPDHCFFTEASQGDVLDYFRLGEGNTFIRSPVGSCTGMLGFTTIPRQMLTIKLGIDHPGFMKQDFMNDDFMKQVVRLSSKLSCNLLKRRNSPDLATLVPTIKTGTKLDNIYLASLKHLETYCLEGQVDLYQVLVLNRLGFQEKSRYYLKKSLGKVRWDGGLVDDFIGGHQIVFAISDYYRIFDDRQLIEAFWPVLKRVGLWLGNQINLQIDLFKNGKQPKLKITGLEKLLWICGSLLRLTELGTALQKNIEIQIYKDHFDIIWPKVLQLLVHQVGYNIEPSSHSWSREVMISSLMVSYPLCIIERGTQFIHQLIQSIINQPGFQGGVNSPRGFKGVNLALTVRLGQALVRENLDCQVVLQYMIDSASATLVWPDLINPQSKHGVGQNGHDPQVLYQMLLWIRGLFISEENDDLYLLPGIFSSQFWEMPQLELENLVTYFGPLSVKVHTIGKITQINFEPHFRVMPQKIILAIGDDFHLVFSDAQVQIDGRNLILSPEIRTIRLNKR